MLRRVLRNPVATIAGFVAVQAVVLGAGWFFVYNATHERVAESVDEVILDNNQRVAASLVDAIGSLPDRFDADSEAWQRAQHLVESVEFGSGGFACILDESGNIACHPDIEDDPSLRSMNLAEHLFVPTGRTEAVAIGASGHGAIEAGIADFAVDGKHYVATQTLTESGTRLLVHQPVSGLSSASAQVTSGLLLRIGLAGFPVLLLTATSGVLFIRGHSRALRRWNEQLESKVAERTSQLHKSRRAIVTALATLADYRDNETGQHVRRISEYTVVIANHLRSSHAEISDEWIDRLRLASMLHDIGKVGVPDAVLRKPGKLTEEEFAAIKSHPSFGADTLLTIHREVESDPLIQMAVEVSLYHHERWDGAGYPVGLSGQDIPLSARITAVADVFDALMSPRVYKPAMSAEQVRKIIRESSGTHFDPQVVDAFLQVEDQLRAIFTEFVGVESHSRAA
ncbi:MAG: HD domain-containing phosphohydrolase [Planctomycetota bacterium]